MLRNDCGADAQLPTFEKKTPALLKQAIHCPAEYINIEVNTTFRSDVTVKTTKTAFRFVRH